MYLTLYLTLSKNYSKLYTGLYLLCNCILCALSTIRKKDLTYFSVLHFRYKKTPTEIPKAKQHPQTRSICFTV